jgi:hypothetical protein
VLVAAGEPFGFAAALAAVEAVEAVGAVETVGAVGGLLLVPAGEPVPEPLHAETTNVSAAAPATSKALIRMIVLLTFGTGVDHDRTETSASGGQVEGERTARIPPRPLRVLGRLPYRCHR